MKKLNALFIASLALVMVLSSCKKKKDDETTPTFSQSFTTSNGVTVDMTWTYGSNSNGEAYVDLDILADDTTAGALGDYEFNSSNSTGTESFDIANGSSNGTYLLGVLFYDYEPGTTTGDATYTLKIYPTGNIASAITVTGSMSGSYSGNGNTYNKYKLVKNGTSYTVEEISPVKAYGNGY